MALSNHHPLKKSSFAIPLNLCTNNCFILSTKKATPALMMKYKHFFIRVKSLKIKIMIGSVWLKNFNERNIKANFHDTDNFKISKRFTLISNLTKYDWLNFSLNQLSANIFSLNMDAHTSDVMQKNFSLLN